MKWAEKGRVGKVLVWTWLTIIVLTLVFGAGYALGEGLLPFSFHIGSRETPAEFDAIKEAWDILRQDYVNNEALDPEKLSQGAIRGMLEALSDPYTSYLSTEDYQSALKEFHGEFEGIGAWVVKEEGQLQVTGVIEGSPAEMAGMKSGDKIVEVNGQSTAEMTLMEAVLKIQGQQGTTVRLLILSEGQTDPVLKEIVRERITIPSVRGEMKENLAYLKISQFSENTSQEIVPLLQSLLSAGAEGIILDLRHNPGGLLPVVVKVASQFLEEGKVVLYQEDNEGKQQTWEAEGGGVATRLPVAVLMDKASASGSEVLAGALQAQGRAHLIGTTTFGKGSVNIIRPLNNGAALYITTARWLTPSGQRIEGMGLNPDLEVQITQEDREAGRDPQLEAAIDYLEEKIQAGAPAP